MAINKGSIQSTLACGVLIMCAMCALFQGVESAAGGRTLLGDDYIRAEPGVPATVPFTSWPSAPPPTLLDLIETGSETFLQSFPTNLQGLVAQGAAFVPNVFGLPIGNIVSAFLPVVGNTGTTLLTGAGLIPAAPAASG